MWCPSAPKFGDRSEKETLKQERCARRDAWEMAKSIFKLKEKDKATFHTPSEVWCLRAPENLWWNRVLQCTIAEQERSEVCGSGAYSSILKPYNGYHSRWRSANKRGSNSVHPRFGFFRDSTDPRGFASSSLSLGKLCEDHGYSYEWTSGQKPQVLFRAMLENTMEQGRYVPIVVPGFLTGPPNSTLSTSSTSVPQDFTIEDATPSPAQQRHRSY